MRRGAPTRRPPGPTRAGREAEQSALRVWVRILLVHKRGLAAIRDHLERDMTLPRFDLLSNLAREDGQTLASLSRHMLVTAGNLTGLVDRAARDGLVERRADPGDRRAWRVHLTPKGQRSYKDAERRHASRVVKLFGAFSPTELATLTRLLDKLKLDIHPGASPERRRRPASRPRSRAQASPQATTQTRRRT